jgi:hypothetical protein
MNPNIMLITEQTIQNLRPSGYPMEQITSIYKCNQREYTENQKMCQFSKHGDIQVQPEGVY